LVTFDGIQAVVVKVTGRTTLIVAVFVTFVSVREVAVRVTLNAADRLPGGVYVTVKGVSFVSAPHCPAPVPVPEQPDCLSSSHLTP
jgi:hypothetical protein